LAQQQGLVSRIKSKLMFDSTLKCYGTTSKEFIKGAKQGFIRCMEVIQSPKFPDVFSLSGIMDPVLIKQIQEIRAANLLSEREILRIHSTRVLSCETDDIPEPEVNLLRKIGATETRRLNVTTEITCDEQITSLSPPLQLFLRKAGYPASFFKPIVRRTTFTCIFSSPVPEKKDSAAGERGRLQWVVRGLKMP
jgi:hypothetical protein